MLDGHNEVMPGSCSRARGKAVKSNSSSLAQSSGSFLLLEDFTRPGSQQSWGQGKGRQLQDTPESSFWSGIPGSMGYPGLPTPSV